MKWFKHHSDSSNNLKLQSLLKDFGWDGYGKWWVIDELVASQGENYRIKASKKWKNYLLEKFKISEESLEKLLNNLAESNLIDKISLKKGILYIPKLREYSDDYQNKVRRKSGHCPDNVPLEEKRREEKRICKTSAEVVTEPFSYKTYLETMKADKRRHIQIIALYWEWRGFDLRSRDLAQREISRDLKVAKDLVAYSNKEIESTMCHINRLKFIDKPTLETVGKYIIEVTKKV
jgi:hypothetical protein